MMESNNITSHSTHVGFEALQNTNDIIDSKQSAVWLEALNRIHIQKSIIEWCLK